MWRNCHDVFLLRPALNRNLLLFISFHKGHSLNESFMTAILSDSRHRMTYTDINSEDRLVQANFAEHLEKVLGWDSVYAWNQETFGSDGTLGRADTREAVLKRDLRAALIKFNPPLPAKALDEAISALTHYNFSRSLIEHNQAFHRLIRDGVPVSYHDAKGDLRHAQAQVIDFRNPANNRFLAVRELKLTGLCAPGYNRRDNLDGQIYRTFACWKNCWARITK
jgi:type I restriction enzyme R subunit